ncbi:hypothetical protein CMI46_00955 [Candidatus Pacearchaeota archaeon]|nr:hypothetical protein [Candidatus Pacearchaeota archaeon]|tara:strand:+ start:438 stop:1106 length:669 start_codon:yes stop_codon:yes gene_type:complete
MEKTNKDDFIELEFTGLVKDGEIFDTNRKEDAEKIDLKIGPKPMIISIGHDMILPGLDKDLEGKEIGKSYEVELQPKDAFQERKKELIRLIPKSAFTAQNLDPKPGMTLALDQTLVRIASVSGGRVLVDFNNPLSGKVIIYKYKILKKVTDIKPKIQSIIDFFFKGQKIEFEIKEKKAIIKTLAVYKPMIEELNKRFKDILGYELDIEEVKEEKENNPSPSQ